MEAWLGRSSAVGHVRPPSGPHDQIRFGPELGWTLRVAAGSALACTEKMVLPVSVVLYVRKVLRLYFSYKNPAAH